MEKPEIKPSTNLFPEALHLPLESLFLVRQVVNLFTEQRDAVVSDLQHVRHVGVVHLQKKVTGMFLYSAVSSPLDRSKHFTLLPPMADLFIPTPNRLLLEAF